MATWVPPSEAPPWATSIGRYAAVSLASGFHSFEGDFGSHPSVPLDGLFPLSRRKIRLPAIARFKTNPYQAGYGRASAPRRNPEPQHGREPVEGVRRQDLLALEEPRQDRPRHAGPLRQVVARPLG